MTLANKSKSPKPDSYRPLFYWVRRSLGLTQYQIADALGVGQDVISKIEGGEAEPSPLVLARLLTLSKTVPATKLYASNYVRRYRAKAQIGVMEGIVK